MRLWRELSRTLSLTPVEWMIPARVFVFRSKPRFGPEVYARVMATSITIQIFGTNKSQDSKKAQRFFKERGLSPHFVDLQEREIALGELRRFVDKFGLKALVDDKSKAYQETGLAHMRVPDEQMMQKLIDDPKLMIQPLVRSGNTLSVGWDEQLWKAWYTEQARKP